VRQLVIKVLNSRKVYFPSTCISNPTGLLLYFYCLFVCFTLAQTY